MRAALALRDAGYETIMINSNPETVSTDFDISDKLFFEPLTLEDVLEVVDREKPLGVIVQLVMPVPVRLGVHPPQHRPVLGAQTQQRPRHRLLADDLVYRRPD